MIWEGLPELLITDGKPQASSLALRLMYIFGLKFRGSKAETADGNPNQGFLGTLAALFRMGLKIPDQGLLPKFDIMFLFLENTVPVEAQLR